MQNQIHMYDDDKTINYHLEVVLLYRLGKLCVPKGELLQLIKESHTSKVAWNFGV